ncbi:MAG: hypothetical protein PHU75_04505 [Candidatus Nanopelagicales bacterium]|nr:hypothetical protein [Candidatus Nanopelagicales bacterium]
MRTAHRTIIAATAAVALLGAAAGTAAAATSTPAPSASATAKATAAASPPVVGGSPSTWTPVTLTRKDKGTSISLVKDQYVIFKGFATKVKFTSSDAKVFVTVNAKTTGTSTSNPGGHAVGSGVAKVTAKNGSTVVATYTITVK